jgi:hypothetical protein
MRRHAWRRTLYAVTEITYLLRHIQKKLLKVSDNSHCLWMIL